MGQERRQMGRPRPVPAITSGVAFGLVERLEDQCLVFLGDAFAGVRNLPLQARPFAFTTRLLTRSTTRPESVNLTALLSRFVEDLAQAAGIADQAQRQLRVEASVPACKPLLCAAAA